MKWISSVLLSQSETSWTLTQVFTLIDLAVPSWHPTGLNKTKSIDTHSGMVFDTSPIKQIAVLVANLCSTQNTRQTPPQTMATFDNPLVVPYKGRMTLILTRRRIFFWLRESPYFWPEKWPYFRQREWSYFWQDMFNIFYAPVIWAVPKSMGEELFGILRSHSSILHLFQQYNT